MAVKKRCGFCRKVLRQDTLTCKNPDCPRYVPDKVEETPSEGNTAPATETPSTDDSTQSDSK